MHSLLTHLDTSWPSVLPRDLLVASIVAAFLNRLEVVLVEGERLVRLAQRIGIRNKMNNRYPTARLSPQTSESNIAE